MMSKSIKQYKQAMDNIKISDSFSQRTEVLLKEMSSAEKITSSGKKSGIRYITFAAGIAAAACAALVFTLNPDILGDNIETADTVIESTAKVTEVTPASETIYTALPAAAPDETEYAEETKPLVTVSEAPAETSVSPVMAAVPETAETSSPAAVQKETVIEEEAAEEFPKIKHLYDIDFTNTEISLTSYLNSGLTAEIHSYSAEDDTAVYEEAAPSGMNFLILDEKSAEDTVSMIADAVYSAPVVEGKEIVSTEFVIDITNLTTDKTAFTINMCYDKTIEVIVYEQDKSFCTFYAVADHDFIEIEKHLFLKFGSLSQYEKFIATQN